jgi:hypothetical protein
MTLEEQVPAVDRLGEDDLHLLANENSIALRPTEAKRLLDAVRRDARCRELDGQALRDRIEQVRERMRLGRVMSGNEERDFERSPSAAIIDLSTNALPPPPKFTGRNKGLIA